MSRLQFVASLPPIQSAISITGNGDGARIKLDVPGTNLIEALKLAMLAGQTFTVTIETSEE